MKFRSLKGTRDILPDETERWQHVEQVIHRVLKNFNYSEIRTPVLETTALFSRSIGELTDIVSKEMYTFTDRSGESVTLRPEGTAAALRAYIQNNLGEQGSLAKLYYIGPMFRQERPQAGRLRQFHQFGAEAIGSAAPELDVEMVLIALQIYEDLGISNSRLVINSVGCEQCRPHYKELLTRELLKLKEKLSADSQSRIQHNPLRVLDSKDENDKALTADLPLMKDHLCAECSGHFTEVQRFFQSLNVHVNIDGRLVRGLDYYTKTAFEITSSDLGSQDALAGGGRYDLLVKELGGKPTPGTGFAAGIERLMMALEKRGNALNPPVRPRIFLIGLDTPSRSWAFVKTCKLRRQGIPAETDYSSRSLKAQMREANRQQAQFVVIAGEQELQSGSAKLKNMQSGEEVTVSLDALEQSLK